MKWSHMTENCWKAVRRRILSTDPRTTLLGSDPVLLHITCVAVNKLFNSLCLVSSSVKWA